MCFVSMDSNQPNLSGRYISNFYDNNSQTFTPAVIMEQVFFEEKFKFQYERVELNIDIATQSIILAFLKGLQNFVKMTCCIAM